MRKRLIHPTPENIQIRGEGWLDLERPAIIEMTSEDKDFPIDDSLVPCGFPKTALRAGVSSLQEIGRVARVLAI